MKDAIGTAVLYVRPGCPLCFALRRAAARAARRHGMGLRVVDVEKDEALRTQYGNEIPVLLLPGGRILKGRVPADEIEAAFLAAGPPAGSAARRSWLRRLLERGRPRAGAAR